MKYKNGNQRDIFNYFTTSSLFKKMDSACKTRLLSKVKEFIENGDENLKLVMSRKNISLISTFLIPISLFVVTCRPPFIKILFGFEVRNQ